MKSPDRSYWAKRAKQEAAIAASSIDPHYRAIHDNMARRYQELIKNEVVGSQAVDAAERDPKWNAFAASLIWQPIAEYDKAAAPRVLMRAGEQWALGYWGVLETFATDDPSDAYPAAPTWRHAQHSLEMALQFEPTQFAPVSEEWEARLFED